MRETFDTRMFFLTWNFSYVEPLALFVHFGQPYDMTVSFYDKVVVAVDS